MPRSHNASVPPASARRPETFAEPRVGSGDKASPALAASEGCIEALAAHDNTAEALRDIRRLLALAYEQVKAREVELLDRVRPRLVGAVQAAEHVVDLERERTLRRKKLRLHVVSIARIAA